MKTIGQQLSGMPQMGAAFAGWTKKITLLRVAQTVVAGLVEQSTLPFTFEGTVQPLHPKEIELKPEGQRAWEWLQVHCLTGAGDLTTNDQVIYNGKTYKVMAVRDYSLNNYVEYHLAFDYQT